MPRFLSTLAAVMAALALAGATGVGARQDAATIPSPEAFFGFAMGAERRLADWAETAEYVQTIGRRSDRVRVDELGRTTGGRPYLLAIVSAPETIASLADHKAAQRALADPRRTPPDEAERLARDGKVVVLVGAGVHSTEVGGTQMMNALLHELASSNAPAVRRILEQAIVLLVPSQNPDGHQQFVEWYRANLGTPYEEAPMPELYHPYAGHDNNRDAYMLTQVESRLLATLMYRDWLPEVYLDVHQMGGSRARIFVPPFKNPANPNVDPLIWSEVNLLGQAMAARLLEDEKPGVIWGELYSGFWQGANSTNPWWHNIVGLLTETASARVAGAAWQEPVTPAATPFDQPPVQGVRPPGPALPPPTDVQYRMNYPRPWLGGAWTFADVVEYQRLSTMGLLEAAAAHRAMLKRNFHGMHRRTIERFSRGDPFAFVVPAGVRDPGTAAHLLRLLQEGGAEVHRAEAPFEADGRRFAAGSHVVLLAQPFGRWVKDLLEPQIYPDVRWPAPDGPVDWPYDVTAWTLGLLMGVETVRVDGVFDAPLVPLDGPARAPAGRVTGRGDVVVIDREANASLTATHRLLAAGADVAWSLDPLRLADGVLEPGAIVARGVAPELAASLAEDLGLRVRALDHLPAERLLPLRLPRVAVYEPWGGAMDAGWTRWVLDRHELPYTRIRHEDVRREDLEARFDVVVLPEMPAGLLLRGLQSGPVRPEHRGGLGDEGVARLRAFVEGGGALVVLGSSTQFAVDYLGVPLVPGAPTIDPDAFFCPGSILRIDVDTGHPVAYGMPREASAMVVQNTGYQPARGGEQTRVVASYPSAPLLESGLLVGEARLRGTGAVLEVPMGRGRVIAHAFRVQHRGQTHGTFKLLLNSILYGAAAGAATSGTTQFEQ